MGVEDTGQVIRGERSRQRMAFLGGCVLRLEETRRMRRSQSARRRLRLETSRLRRSLHDRGVLRRSLAMIQLTKDQMAIDFLRRVKARAIGRCRRIKRDFNPVKSARIALRFAIRVR